MQARPPRFYTLVLNRIAPPSSRLQIAGPVPYAPYDKNWAFAQLGGDAVVDGFDRRLTKENSEFDAAERSKQEQAVV
jgi:hypothetical protein